MYITTKGNKAMTIIEALNNPEARELIESIEDWGDKHLECNIAAKCRASLIAELSALGYDYK